MEAQIKYYKTFSSLINAREKWKSDTNNLPHLSAVQTRILVIFTSVWPSENMQWWRLATKDYPLCLHVWSRSVVLRRTKHLFFFHLITLTRMATSEKRISKVLLHILFLGCRLPFSSFFFSIDLWLGIQYSVQVCRPHGWLYLIHLYILKSSCKGLAVI